VGVNPKKALGGAGREKEQRFFMGVGYKNQLLAKE